MRWLTRRSVFQAAVAATAAGTPAALAQPPATPRTPPGGQGERPTDKLPLGSGGGREDDLTRAMDQDAAARRQRLREDLAALGCLPAGHVRASAILAIQKDQFLMEAEGLSCELLISAYPLGLERQCQTYKLLYGNRAKAFGNHDHDIWAKPGPDGAKDFRIVFRQVMADNGLKFTLRADVFWENPPPDAKIVVLVSGWVNHPDHFGVPVATKAGKGGPAK